MRWELLKEQIQFILNHKDLAQNFDDSFVLQIRDSLKRGYFLSDKQVDAIINVYEYVKNLKSIDENQNQHTFADVYNVEENFF